MISFNMMIMNRYIIGVLCVLGLNFSVTAQGQKDPAALTILESMSVKYKAYASFQAEFTNSLINPDKSKEDITGKITVMGDKYKLELGDQEVINDGKNVWTYLREVNEVNVTDYFPEDQEISPSNIFNIYKEGYKYVYVEERDGGNLHIIDLEPEAKGKDIYKIRMAIAEDKELKSFTLFERSGVKYMYSINNMVVDKGIGDDFFNFDEADYPGVEVIDFRN